MPDAHRGVSHSLQAVDEAARSQEAAYAAESEDERPLRSYVALLATYGTLTGSLAAVVRLRGKRLPERIAAYDLVLVIAGTHKLSRLLAKDSVLSPVRAPFTRYKGVSGPAELTEEVRGTGIQKVVGELLTCPFCLGQWVATGFMFGLVVAPRFTRLVAATFAALAGSDFLHLAYATAEQKAGG
jgi:hypothetical protein